MSSPATIIIENFPIYHFEAKSRLNKDLHALFMKSGGFSLQGCIKGESVFLTKQTCTTKMDTGVYQLH
mgnify:FL=1